ncbi:response regulator [Patescibacteria group bacterium]|nr:response regulator [Patescibacteria group bacterium]
MNKNKPKIIIVEDDPNLLDLYAYEFKNLGFDVIKAEDGMQGLASTISEKPDLVILDVMLPKLDGISMLKELRLTPGDVGRTPVIVLTALSDTSFANEAMRLGANEYFIKTDFMPNKMMSKIKKYLKKGSLP